MAENQTIQKKKRWQHQKAIVSQIGKERIRMFPTHQTERRRQKMLQKHHLGRQRKPRLKILYRKRLQM